MVGLRLKLTLLFNKGRAYLDSAFNILNRFRVVQPKSEVWGAYRPVMRTIYILKDKLFYLN